MNRLANLYGTLLVLLWFLVAYGANASDDSVSVNVMGPLILTDETQWQSFSVDLDAAKEVGVQAISIDVWWGLVEKDRDQEFDWRYYDRLFDLILSKGLRLVPIMSFHQCGGNVGDECNIPIPNWIWHTEGPLKPNDLKYMSEQGNLSGEYVSLWADHIAVKQYREFMLAFEQHFASLKDDIDELNISMGPAGELRYPSYNGHDKNTNYPTRGAFQSYGEVATQDFQLWLKNKYRDIGRLNKSWSMTLASFEDVSQPKNMDHFVNSGQHIRSQYGQDFVAWYHDALIEHAAQVLQASHESFSKAFKNIDLGFKLPGIHWQMAAPDNLHRSAEMAAGLIDAGDNIRHEEFAYGYLGIMELINSFNFAEREIILHFTCLEMDDNPQAPAYSKAKSLVEWIANAAKSKGITLKGENALAAGVQSDKGWSNISHVIQKGLYDGVTILRLQFVSSGYGKEKLAHFIQTQKGDKKIH